LTVSGITASDKTYDGSTSANLGTSNILYNGLINGDSFSGSYTGTFDNKNVGTGKTVTISSSYSGDDVSNYSVTSQSSTIAAIVKKALTASASASNKTYNGNTTATTTLSFSGLIGTETLGQSVSSTFNNKNVGTGKTVTINSITLSDGSNGGLAGNYTISTGQTTTANITAKALTVSGITASNKTYDANTVATLDLTGTSYSGLVAGDDISISATGTFDNKNVGTGKTVNISSSFSGVDVGNYSITDQSSTTANITSSVSGITIRGITANNKNYDGNNSATLDTSNVSYSGLVDGDDVTGSFSGTFSNANAGSNKTVNISSSYSGADVGNYTITDQSTTTGNIIAKALTASTSASNKTYNGNTTATVTLSFSGLIGSETLGQSVTAAFNNKNVGTGKTVTVSAITLSDGSNGGLASNYSISAGQTTTANITAKSLTVSGITASNKTYDANTNATIDIGSVSYSGLVSGDNFVVSASGTFDNKNVGTEKTVTISSSYSGSDVSNYSVINQASTTANITAKALTVSGITASDKSYDGSTTATLGTSSILYTGLINGDSFSGSYSGTFNNANVGTGKTVTISSSYSGDDVSNYSVTNQSSTTASVVKKSLTASASASNKTYNGNSTANTTLSFSGLVGSETLGQSVSSTFNNKNVGTGKTVTVDSITLSDGSNGGLASNYTISAGQTTTANITAKALTVSGITASNKTYDGNTNATMNVGSVSYSGLVSGDNFVVSATGTFDNKNIGTGKTVTISSSYSGSDVSNYSVTNQSSTSANVTAKALTVSGITASDKSYDGSTTATLGTSNILYSGLVSGDSFTGSYSGTFNNANVANNKTVTISSLYSGDDVSNYSITNQSSTTATVVKKALTASASASNKTYNGNATATTSLTFSGLIGSETLAQSVSSTFNNKNVETGKTVTVNSITLSDGSNGGLASNYTISAGQTTTANIVGKALTVSGITAPNKTYDGNTNAPLDVSNISYSGLVSGDDIGGSFSGTFENKNIGTGKTVTISSSYSGVDSGNYSVTDQSSTTANITTRALTVSGLTASNKTYDATTSATLDTSSVSYAGLVSGDSFSGSYTGTFNDANVGTSKLVTISSSYSGNDINNYSITDQSSTGADITKASPTISGLSNQSKYSDENYTLAGVPSISGLSISYSSDDTNVADVDSSTGAVSIITTGTSTITASIAATSNYNAATASYILTISTRPVSSGSPSQVASDSAIRTTTSSVSGNSSSNGSTNVGSGSYAGSSINNSVQVVSFSAKVVVLRPEQTPKAEGVYEFNNEESKLDDIANDNAGFQKLGEIIGITEYSIEIKADDLYNYTLEVRDGGILIKPGNLKSLLFAENYRTKVIDTAMEEVEKNFGIPSFQIRTIVLDFYKRYTQAN
ncbi:YDG domain-containing protein, partial [Alphaproteobacteria bacterium]|nr:YDG domain-containing protein [Alphaproteobacteria bacterium]